MSKVSKKLPEPNTDMEQPTASSRQRKKMNVPDQPRTRSGGKALKTTRKIKKNLQRTLSKKASKKTTNPIRKSKKAKGPTLFGHYHRLNETLSENQNELQQKQEVAEKPTTSTGDLGGQ
ncbi:uncharacterized protein Cadr_000002599 [Camelus dromedarius]|uniref:Spermatid nuclear transition protein 4-like n=3 Tax=Camelus TaxID=9836 RepID=A0A5N4C141_CAMDR|nr:uncharacterized protein CXorf51A [Camelus ferus]XP_031302103.1 uncharacterized protein CXorf51A-like [Camelus dromedarius]XP_045374766.1 uncharacterized protein CXorf51A-like [Camelus bactrianus]KAB1252580.1 uncharacterized protein Cadr_000002599 [Camelus dromedarius]